MTLLTQATEETFEKDNKVMSDYIKNLNNVHFHMVRHKLNLDHFELTTLDHKLTP